jgi:hypothetical protein
MTATSSLRIPAPYFALGTVVVTNNFLTHVDPDSSFEALERHANQDGSNAGLRTVANGFFRDGPRAFSMHRTRHGIVFFLLTETDHARTKMMLPDDL